eukprot:1700976-Rhodomonas_salina.2
MAEKAKMVEQIMHKYQIPVTERVSAPKALNSQHQLLNPNPKTLNPNPKPSATLCAPDTAARA